MRTSEANYKRGMNDFQLSYESSYRQIVSLSNQPRNVFRTCTDVFYYSPKTCPWRYYTAESKRHGDESWEILDGRWLPAERSRHSYLSVIRAIGFSSLAASSPSLSPFVLPVSSCLPRVYSPDARNFAYSAASRRGTNENRAEGWRERIRKFRRKEDEIVSNGVRWGDSE